MTEPSPPRRRGIQSVEIGMRVLSALAANTGPASLSALAQDSGLSASQAHRYLSSLIAAGMARQEPGTGLYDMDAGAIRLGLAALARLDLFTSADTTFRRFARETGHTCMLAVWGEMGPIIVRWFAGNPPVITSLAVGSVLPLLSSATGRVFYAFGDPATMDARANGAAPPGLRDRIRQLAAAWVTGDLIPGLRVVAAPVFDLQGALVLAAAAIANGTPDPAADARMEHALIDSCRQLTESLGGRWPVRPPVYADRMPGRPRAPGPQSG